MSYNTILVPLDGSSLAEHALPLALSIARRSGAALRLVRVHVPYPIAVSEYGMASYSAELDLAGMRSEEAQLQDLASRITTLSNLPCTATILGDMGTVTGLLASAAQGVDLMVMTTHGRGAFSSFWLGSVTEEILRSAPCPVLTVRPRPGPVDLAAETRFQRILIPLDGSPASEQVLEPAIALGSLMDSEYHLLHVSTDAGAIDDAQHYLDRVAARLQSLVTDVNTHAVWGPHVTPRILEVADEMGADLVALETHGRRGYQRWRLGSVADKLIRSAPLPVLTHRTPVAAVHPSQPAVQAPAAAEQQT